MGLATVGGIRLVKLNLKIMGNVESCSSLREEGEKYYQSQMV